MCNWLEKLKEDTLVNVISVNPIIIDTEDEDFLSTYLSRNAIQDMADLMSERLTVTQGYNESTGFYEFKSAIVVLSTGEYARLLKKLAVLEEELETYKHIPF